jgi:hypothetical protein
MQGTEEFKNLIKLKEERRVKDRIEYLGLN